MLWERIKTRTVVEANVHEEHDDWIKGVVWCSLYGLLIFYTNTYVTVTVSMNFSYLVCVYNTNQFVCILPHPFT